MDKFERHLEKQPTPMPKPEGRRWGILWTWWFWALAVGFIMWSSLWGWGPGWGGWWWWNGGKTVAQIQAERQHEPRQQQIQRQGQELH